MNTTILEPEVPETSDRPHDASAAWGGAAALAALALTACGGGGGLGSEASDAAFVNASEGARKSALSAAPAAANAAPALSRAQAARFLSRAAFGGTAAEIARLQSIGVDEWLNEQFSATTTPGIGSYVSLAQPGGKDQDTTYADFRLAPERAMWRKLLTSGDVLRQRVTLALSGILVISIPLKLGQYGLAAAGYLDILEKHAFGNYRDLLLDISRSPAMGAYLTFLGNRKADPITGSQPDENYARELMQLFTIGLYQLKPNGKLLLKDGVPQETYTQQDVMGLARVFTGWVLDSSDATDIMRVVRPMVQSATGHERGEKKFLGKTIEAGKDGQTSLVEAIDTLMLHPNVGPFIGRQLIQRLVTSNPSAEYVARVAAAFDDVGSGRKGNLKATIRAVLTDEEAMSADTLIGDRRGKLREPMVRFVQWARTFGLKPNLQARFDLGNLSSPAGALGQSPLRSPTVFNFFRPGYVPPNGKVAEAGLVAPEFQITTETSVVGYVNFMHACIVNGVAGSVPDYTGWLDLAADAEALLDELNLVMAAGQISTPTLRRLRGALETIPGGDAPRRRLRLIAALTMVMAAPEYLVQK